MIAVSCSISNRWGFARRIPPGRPGRARCRWTRVRRAALAACARSFLDVCTAGARGDGDRRVERRSPRDPGGLDRVPVGSTSLRSGSAGFGVCAVPVGDGVPSLRCYDDFPRRLPQEVRDRLEDGRRLCRRRSRWHRVRTIPWHHDHLRLPRDRPGGRARARRPARSRGPRDPAGMEPVPRPGAWSVNRRPTAGWRSTAPHGCWGGRTIRARRVDLGSTDPEVHRASVDDLRALRRLAAGGRGDLPGGASRRTVRPVRPRRIVDRRWPEACSSWASTRCRRIERPDLRREHAARRPPRQPDGRARRAARASWTIPGWPWPSIPAMPTSAPASRRRPSRPGRSSRRPTCTTTTAGRMPTNPPAAARSIGPAGASHSTRSVTPDRSCWSVSGPSADESALHRPDVLGGDRSDRLKRLRRPRSARMRRAVADRRRLCGSVRAVPGRMPCRARDRGRRPGRPYRYPTGSEGFRRRGRPLRRFARGGCPRVIAAQPA